MDKILYYLYKKYNGNFLKIYESLSKREVVPTNEYNNLEVPKNWISLLDSEYPNFMKAYYKPQFFVVKENDKYFIYYGEKLESKFEVPQDNETQYIELMNKYC